MLQLLDGERDAALDQLRPVGVVHDERHGRRRGLALVGGVVEQERVEVREDGRRPFRRRRRLQPHQPPLTAGRIAISQPSGTRVASPCASRMFTSATNTLTWGRTAPCSVTTRSRRPGWSAPRAASASPTVARRSLDRDRRASVRERLQRPGDEKPHRHQAAFRARRDFTPDARRARHVVGDARLDADDRRQALAQQLPGSALVARAVELAAARAEVDAGRLEAVDRHAVADDRLEGVLLRQAARHRLPGRAGVARAVDAQLSVGRATEPVRVQRHDEGGVRIAGVHAQAEAEVRRDSVGHVLPGVAAVVGAVEPPVVLEKETAGPGAVRDLVDALAELGVRVRVELGADAPVPGLPGHAAVVGPVGAARGSSRPSAASRIAGSTRTVWRQSPPPPGCHFARWGWFQRPSFSFQVLPASCDSKSAEGSTPQ